MKNFKKIAALVLTGVLAVSCLAGCGSSSDDAATTDTAAAEEETVTVSTGMYRAHFDSSYTGAIPSYQFVGGDMSANIAAGTQFDLTLKLSDDGTYTLFACFSNENNPDESDPYYIYIYTQADGTYTIDGNTVTISDGENVETSFEAGSDSIDNPAYAAASFADGATGTWTESDNAKVAECVPSTTFTVEMVDGSEAITTWEAAGSGQGNPND